MLKKLPSSKRQWGIMQQFLILPKIFSVFLPCWRRGKPQKYGRKDDKENRVHEAVQEKHIVIF